MFFRHLNLGNIFQNVALVGNGKHFCKLHDAKKQKCSNSITFEAQIPALKMRVRQTIGINMVWRTHIFSKIQVKMSRSKMSLSLGKNTDY